VRPWENVTGSMSDEASSSSPSSQVGDSFGKAFRNRISVERSSKYYTNLTT
jgi:hypothetical protein